MKKLAAIIGFLVLLTTTIYSQENQVKEDYYFTKTIKGNFDEITVKVKEAFKVQGFGVITEINMKEKLSEKLENVDMKPYRILGVCNPKFAYETIQAEENIGLFLPCKVIIKQIDESTSEVVAVNPSALMKMLGNAELIEIADKVSDKFKQALKEL